jgi:hypothetical protein
MNPTIGGGNVGGVRDQDLLVRDIVETNKWERPVYFSVTVASSNFIGLDRYLQMQGMALQVMPFEMRSSDGQYPINKAIMRQCLMDSPSKVYTGPHYGFRFTNLKNPNVYYDDNARRLSLNYRNPFMRLAVYDLQRGDSTGTISTLHRMEEKIPIEVIPMDYRILSDVARIYLIAGDRKDFEKYSAIVERDALAAIQRNPMDVSSAYNPYRILLDLYDTQRDYNKELGLLSKLQPMFPNEKGIELRIKQLQSLIAGSAKAEVDSLGK